VAWDIFLFASENNIDVNMDTVTEFIRKRIGDVVPTVTIKTESVNQYFLFTQNLVAFTQYPQTSC
jgi:hypothetical protein